MPLIARGPTPSKPAPRPASAELLARARAALAGGLDPDETAALLGVAPERADELVAEARAGEEVRLVGRRPEAVYVDYVLRSGHHLRELDELKEWLRSTKQGAAAVGAVKAKQDILDRIIKLGQDLGFVRREPTQHSVVVARLDDAGLRELLARELTGLTRLMDRAGDTPLLELSPAAMAAASRGLDPVPPRLAESPSSPVVRRKVRSLPAGGA
jgi:hypothetical protein